MLPSQDMYSVERFRKLREEVRPFSAGVKSARMAFRKMQGFLIVHLSLFCNMDRPGVLKELKNSHLRVSIYNRCCIFAYM